jgi:hypothetical protein
MPSARRRAPSHPSATPFSGNHSCNASAMASVSHTVWSPFHRTGTRREGDQRSISASHSVEWKRSFFSSNGMPSCFISTHGRIDHDE